MTTVYTPNASFGTQSAGFRAYLNYSTSSTSTTTTVTWKIGIQGRHNYGYSFTATLSGSASKSISGSLSSNPGSTWTTIKTASGSTSFTKGTSSASKTFKISASGPKEGQYSGTQTVSKSVTVTVPALASYAITYYSNGGTGTTSGQTKYYGKNLTLRANGYSRTGYAFNGWGTSASATTAAYAASATYTGNAALNLYAIWAKTITLSFNANGGADAPTSTSATVYNATTSYTFTIPSATPTRTDFSFLGWSTDPTATTATYTPGDTVTLSSDQTLYAVWEEAYTAPTISNYRVYRSTSAGVDDDTGTYVNVEFDWGINLLYATLAHVYVFWKTREETDYDDPSDPSARVYEVSVPVGTKSGSVEIGTVGSGISPLNNNGNGYAVDTIYDFKIEIRDTHESGGQTVPNSSSITSFISAAYFTMDFLRGGKGMAIGAASRQEGLVVAMDFMAQTMTGVIQMYGGQTPPRGWLPCDGRAVNRNLYSRLFNAIGTTWGAGDGSTTFNLPDLRGRSAVGLQPSLNIANSNNWLYTDKAYYRDVNSYMMGRVYSMHALTASTQYTIQLWDVYVRHSAKTTADGSLNVSVYWGGASTQLHKFEASVNNDGITSLKACPGESTAGPYAYAKHLTGTFTTSSSAPSSATMINFYNSVSNVDGNRVGYIGRWMLNPGSEALPWEPTLFYGDSNFNPYSSVGAVGGFVGGKTTSAQMVSHSHSVNSVSISSSGAHTNHIMNGYGATLASGSTGWRFGSGGNKTASGIIEGGAHTHTVPSHDTNATGGGGDIMYTAPYAVVQYIICTGEL